MFCFPSTSYLAPLIETDTICVCAGSFVGESMHDDGALVFAYYKEGSADPTFLYIAPGLKEIKC